MKKDNKYFISKAIHNLKVIKGLIDSVENYILMSDMDDMIVDELIAELNSDNLSLHLKLDEKKREY